ncbi:hypothetical protein ACLMJK_007401 [Lecanora helva]
MSLKPLHSSPQIHSYCTVGHSPSPPYSSAPKRPVPSRSGSSSLSASTRALIRTRTGELRAEQRPKLVSHPSGSNASSRSSGSTIFVTTPGAAAQQQLADSREKNDAKEDCEPSAETQDDAGFDGEDGSIVLVKILPAGTTIINAPTKASPAANLVDSSSKGELMKAGAKSANGDDAHSREEGGPQNRPPCPGSALSALTEAMKLESQLLLLKRVLHLYQAFDNASGEVFRITVHDDFFINLNQIMHDIVAISRPLGVWTESRRHHRFQSHALHIFKHLRTAHLIVGAWNNFYDWLVGVSNKSIQYQREEGRVSIVTWERRRRECMETVERLLRLVGDVEIDEGARGVLEMQDALRRQWRADGMVGRKEAENLGWVWGVRI